jgi:Putative lumazine-binding
MMCENKNTFSSFFTLNVKTLSIILLLFISNITLGQNTDKEAVKTVINRLFEGMKKGDSTIARSVFHQNAITQTIGFSKKTEKNYFHFDSRLNDFMKSIGTPHSQQWDERPGEFDIKIDNQMAQVWVPYEFYLDGKFNHCGVDIFTLYKESFDWKIIYLVDTMRKDNCIK